MKHCLLCGRRARFVCDGGCRDDGIAYCGYCSRKKIVVWVGHAMEQRLCAVCALREQGDSRPDGIFDARYYTVEQLETQLNYVHTEEPDEQATVV